MILSVCVCVCAHVCVSEKHFSRMNCNHNSFICLVYEIRNNNVYMHFSITFQLGHSSDIAIKCSDVRLLYQSTYIYRAATTILQVPRST